MSLIVTSFVLGAVLLDYNIEAAGASFLSLSLVLSFYYFIVWLWKRGDGFKKSAKSISTEYSIIATIAGVFFLIGAIEFYPSVLPALVFTELSVFALLFAFLNKKYLLDYNQLFERKEIWSARKILFWCVVVAYTIALVVLTIYEYEPLVNLMALAYFTVLLVLGIRWVFRQVRMNAVLQAEKAQIELQQLKSQVSPHFFFNMLNNLYALVEIDSIKAKELILKLSDLMRYSIYEGQKELVPLQDEVDYLENYVALHKMRYHKEIDAKLDTDIRGAGRDVMPLMFIILVENAFKHGVERLRDNAFVHMQLLADDTKLEFQVQNNYDSDSESEPAGIGLKNLRRRLELFYPNQHALDISHQEGIYRVRLSLRLK